MIQVSDDQDSHPNQPPRTIQGEYNTVEEAVSNSLGGQVIYNTVERGYLNFDVYYRTGRVIWIKGLN
jgi:hypothetical protein